MRGGWALDGKGHAYFGIKAISKPHKSNGRHFADVQAVGTVYKVRLETGKMAGEFEYCGNRKLAEPSPYLGTHQWVPNNRYWDFERTRPDTSVDSDERFVDICDLAVDEAGNIYVADGYPRRIKMYRPNGQWIGEIDGFGLDGGYVGFYDLINIRTAPKALYVLGIPRLNEMAGPAAVSATYLIKFAGEGDTLRQVWQIRMDAKARGMAVDRWAEEPIVWVGNGAGAGTISRVVDRGEKPGEPKHVGGMPDRGVFVAPELVALDDRGGVFVYDYGREKVVRTDDDTTTWTEAAVRLPQELRDVYFLRKGVGQDQWRFGQAPSSMRVDTVNSRLLLAFDRATASKGFECFDLKLNPLPPFLPLRERGTYWSNRGQVHLAVDDQGNTYVSDAHPETAPDGYFRSDSWKPVAGKLYGAVYKYGPDGAILDSARWRTFFPTGSMDFDSKGNLYIMDLARATYEDIGIWFPDESDFIADLDRGREPKHIPRFLRDGTPVEHPSDVCYLVKFPADGGVRNTQSELWAHRGVGIHYGSQCQCANPGDLVAVDDADRIYSCDGARRFMKMFDTAGNLVARWGWCGNAETVPAADGSGEVGFFQIWSMDARGNSVYVVDKALRRVAKFTMRYRSTVREGDSGTAAARRAPGQLPTAAGR